MVAKKLRHHCATCGLVFERPQGWAYCSKSCELGRKGEGDPDDSPWMGRIFERRLALCADLERAHPLDRPKIMADIQQTHEAERLMREHLSEANAPRTSALFWAPLVDREADRFETAARKSVAAAIRLGRRLIEAKAALEHGEFGRLFAGHPDAVEGAVRFSRQWGAILMQIASNRVIANGNHGLHLPSDVRSIYLLARLPEEELEQAITAGTVRPDMGRDEIRALLPATEEEPHEPMPEVVRALAPVSRQLKSFLRLRPECLRDVRAHLRAVLRRLGGR